MAYYVKESYPPLIGGESQQLEQDRHPNQVTEMLNMLPDAVSGIRRRGGFTHLKDMHFSTMPYMQHITVKEREYLLLIEPGSYGVLQIYDIAKGTIDFTLGPVPYLQGGGPQDLDYVVHSDELYILNRVKIANTVLQPSAGLDTKRNGYFVSIAGAFQMRFNVGLIIDGVRTTVDFTTPETGAILAQPENIATQLTTLANAHATIGTANGITWTREGANVHVQSTDHDIIVVTDTSSTYLRVSNSANVRDTIELAAKLPDTADGMIIRTGTKLSSAYWSWSASTQQWNETVAYGEDITFNNMPIRLYHDGSQWYLDTIQQKGRMAGDVDNNPNPSFADKAITGIGSFQGRLILLSGDSISMSATNEVGQWFRASVVTLADTDSIDAQGTTTTGVQYRYAVPLDGDLILFSATQQSTITGRSVVTSKTISLAPSGMLPMLPHIKPVHTGRGLLIASPTAPGYCSIWEISGGQFRDGVYTQHDTTLHLPTYIEDNLFALTAGQTGKYAVAVGGDCSLKMLSTVQHLGEVVQQSWHTWRYLADTRPVTIVQAQLHNEVLYVLLRVEDQYRLVKWSDSFTGKIDFKNQLHLDEPKECLYSDEWLRPPVSSFQEMTNGVFLALYRDPVTFEEQWRDYDYMDFEWGGAAGVYIAYTTEFVNCIKVLFGWRYISAVQPTTPMVKVGRNKSADDRPQLHRILAHCADTGTVQLEVYDAARDINQAGIVPAIQTSNFRDIYLRSRDGVMQFPVRTDMRSTHFTFRTADVYDMRFIGIEYGYRPRMRYARAPTGG